MEINFLCMNIEKINDIFYHYEIYLLCLGKKEEYIEDLRVRKQLLSRLIAMLTEVRAWRPGHGLEPLHMYYTGFLKYERKKNPGAIYCRLSKLHNVKNWHYSCLCRLIKTKQRTYCVNAVFQSNY